MNKKQDGRIWQRMGQELAALHDLILAISCDSDYCAVMDKKTWDKLDSLADRLDIVRSYAEDRMSKHIPDWTTRTFCPVDRTEIYDAINEFRRHFEGENNELEQDQN